MKGVSTDRKRFEKTWEKEIKKNDYIIAGLKNGTLIKADEFKTVSSSHVVLVWKGHQIALVGIRTIESIRGRVDPWQNRRLIPG